MAWIVKHDEWQTVFICHCGNHHPNPYVKSVSASTLCPYCGCMGSFTGQRGRWEWQENTSIWRMSGRVIDKVWVKWEACSHESTGTK